MKKAVLFDFDGTIMNTNDLIVDSWQLVFNKYYGADGDVDMITASFGEPIEFTASRFFPGYDPEEVIDVYRTWHLDRYEDSISLFPGVLDMIKELKAGGHKLGVVTSRLKHTATIGMNKYHLFDYFDAFIALDDTEKHKPDPEPIFVTLKLLDSLPQEAIFVGDSKHDIESAKNAGVESVLVAWSLACPPATCTLDPDYIINTPAELLDIVRS